MMARELWVYVGARRIGRLTAEQGKISFEYSSENEPAISVRLPPRKEPYDDPACRTFFTNLLPEGEWRQALCRQLGIAPEDDFALLEAIGEDCAGAVSVRPNPDWKESRGRYVATTEGTLAKWAKNPLARPRVVATPGLRLSLAGAQDKLLVQLDGRKPYLCEHGAPSTVILKPDIRDAFNAIEASALNELASMELARAAGIETPRSFWFASSFAVERFDRVRDGRAWRRLHQEDFAQVLGVPAFAKYDVTWSACFEVASRYATTPSKARLALVDRLLFNLFLGNNDAHAKNFALLHDVRGHVRLAPAYDLVATSLYPSLSERFAMAIGHAKTLKELDETAWRGFSDHVDISVPYVRRRSVELAAAVTGALDGLGVRLERENPALAKDVYPLRRRRGVIEGLSEVVRRNVRSVGRSLGGKRG